jgi:8-oxo-dGTP pyrophosphatase MutT (NUDIX family)
MKRELSAGGIVVTKTSEGWNVLVIHDMNDVLTFPKGKVEPDEPLTKAAVREISEEVGLSDLELIKELPKIEYWYKKVKTIHKIVHFFIFRSKNKATLVPQTEEGIHDVQWVPIEKAIEIIGYPKTNKQLLLWTLNTLRMLKK